MFVKTYIPLASTAEPPILINSKKLETTLLLCLNKIRFVQLLQSVFLCIAKLFQTKYTVAKSKIQNQNSALLSAQRFVLVHQSALFTSESAILLHKSVELTYQSVILLHKSATHIRKRAALTYKSATLLHKSLELLRQSFKLLRQ